MANKEQPLIVCPHCGNKTSQHIEHTIVRSVDLIDPSGEVVDTQEYVHFLVRCSTCDSVSLYIEDVDALSGIKEKNYLDKAYLLYPSKKTFSRSVPEGLKESYIEAGKVKKISSTAFAVLIRRSLEYLCKDQKAKGNSLKIQLEDLAERGIIPENLSKMGNALRSLGNVGAHASDIKIDPWEADSMDDFMVAMIEYVYVAPDKLKRLSESIAKKKKT